MIESGNCQCINANINVKCLQGRNDGASIEIL